MGYHVVWIAPKGKDGGLDLIAQSDPLGVNGPRINISLGGFTSDAEASGRRSSRRITLIDGEGL